MKVFLSHSGDRSKALALALRDFIRKLLPPIDPWISTGIEGGLRWEPELASNLRSADIGIVCITADNMERPWLQFESGALSQKLDGRVCTVLLDVAKGQVPPPLGQFQHTLADKDGLRELLNTINSYAAKIDEKPRLPSDLTEIFDMLWPQLDTTIQSLRTQAVATTQTRPLDEMIAEVLEIVRDLARGRDRETLDEVTHDILVRRLLMEKLRRNADAEAAGHATAAAVGQAIRVQDGQVFATLADPILKTP
jgi:hypothetical protein